MDNQMRPWLDIILQLLSLHGYSVFSLIDDLLARSNSENERINLLREGLEHDAAGICARLLNHNPASASVSAWALGFAQSTLRSDGQPKNYKRGATIDILPDTVLLKVFNFCLCNPTKFPKKYPLERTRKWQSLVNVCQMWRRIIFASQRHLDLYLSCSHGTPIRENLAFWPVAIPLTLDYPGRMHPVYGLSVSPDDEDNIIFALEHARRVHRIEILATGSLLRKAATNFQRPFPTLTHLDLEWDLRDLPAPHARGIPAIPVGFLGGTAPHLRYLRLRSISFPELPTFLLSAPNLVTLKLKDIPQNGYISPEAMAGSLAALTKLITLSISFRKGASSPDQRRSHLDPPMRTILPALTNFHFIGCSEYLEDFVAQIDTPCLNNARIEYFMQQIQIPQLSRFIDRTAGLNLSQFRRAEVTFFDQDVYFELQCPQRERRQAHVSLKILGQAWLDKQVPCMVHVLSQLLARFSNVNHLFADGDQVQSREMDVTEWIPFFYLFSAVGTLKLSGDVATYIADALEDAANPEDPDMVTDVFPMLYLIWLELVDNYDDYDDEEEDDDDDDEDYRHEPAGSIEQFRSMRQLARRPVTVVNSQDDFLGALRSHI